jgi:hypothetical protein
VKNVPGIGEQGFASIKEKITVGDGEKSAFQESAAPTQAGMSTGKAEE